jgi:predicted DsbA family dithiol-disulfide isomerase
VRIERLRREYEIQVRWTAFPLHPETPEGGLTLEDLFAGRPVNLAEIKNRLRQVAGELGLPLGDRDRTYNSRLAQELGKWAETRGRGEEFHDAMFRVYFVDGRNIGSIPVLLDVASSVGLPREEAREVLGARAFREAVDQDWNRSHAMGVTAVPTFVMGKQKVVGAQPYEVLEQLMKEGGVRRRGQPKRTSGLGG